MIHLKLKVDSRAKMQLKDGSFPIVVQIYKNKQKSFIQTGISCGKDDLVQLDNTIWSVKTNSYVKNIKRGTATIMKKFHEVATFIDELTNPESFTATELKHRFLGKETISFSGHLRTTINELKEKKKYSSAKWYKDALSLIEKESDGEVSFKQFDYTFVKKIETKYLAKGNSINGLAIKLRALRIAYNEAARRGLIEKKSSPFNTYKIRTEPTRKRALNKDVLKVIRDYKSEQWSALFDAQNYFLLSFYLRGINFRDLAYLEPKHITEGIIDYKRSKSSVHYKFLIPEPAMKILTDYMNHYKQKYILPILDPKLYANEESQHNLYTSRRDWVNELLQQILKESDVKLSSPITFYAARHTWATEGINMGLSIDDVQKALGHKDRKTTEIYIKSLGFDNLAEANEKIIDLD